MSTEIKSLAELNRLAIPLLCKELGIANTVRFLRQFTPGLGDYIQERKNLFADQTLEQLVDEIEQAVSGVISSSQRSSKAGHSLAP
jgi:hypothetical protein